LASERKSADAFETALKREMQRTQSVNGAQCPAPDVLAAYYDRALARGERAHVDTHLLSCVRCQSMIAAIARAHDSERSPEPEPARWLFWVTRLVAPVAVIGVVIAIAIGMRTREQQARAPEVIALASPVAEMKPQFAQPAPAPPPQALPERLAPSVAQPANPPAATTLGKSHHKGGSRERAAIAGKSATSRRPEELTHEEVAKAETAPALSDYSSSSSAAKSAGAPANAPSATLEAASAPAIEAGNATRSEAPVGGGAIPSVAGAAASAPALQASERMAQTRSAMLSASGAGAVVSRSVGAMAEAPRVNQVSSPDGSVVWQFGAGGAIKRSGNSSPWLAMRSGVTTDLLAASAPSNDVCWMVGKSGTIVRTLDGGAQWQIVKPPSLDNFTAITATDSNNATVITADGQRYVTRDGGVTWSSP
jgi:hypothetical protein